MSFPNFLISDQSAEEFFNSLKITCLNTGTSNLPSFGNESSFLSSSVQQKSQLHSVLAIDVGGTRTKVCVRSPESGGHKWQEILDLDNNQLKTEGSTKGLSRMTHELAKQIALSCQSKKIALKFDGISIVWSNKLQSFPLKGDVSGVGAKVFGCKSGQAYRKGEWWNSDLEDGDDISAAFISGLNSARIQSKILVIANDTVFGAKALPGAMAGVVASTGSNTTVVPANSSILFNSECGGAIEIPAKLLNLQKTTACLPGTNTAIKIEDITAGKGLPKVYQVLLLEAEASGLSELNPICSCLESKPLDAKELGLIVAGKISEGLGNRISGTLPDSATKHATEIAQQLIKNAGKMCAVLILISISNQLSSHNDILVALDSSQARFVEGYKQSLDSFLSSWNKAHSKNVRYELLSPEGQISVPLRGAANAIEQFL